MTKKKILVVEDEKSLLAAIKSKLELSGYNVVSAEDGSLAEKTIEKGGLDLVLLDILLPKKNGIQVLEDLQKKKIEIPPVIIISNSGQPVEIDKALKLGARDYLVKADFNPSDVMEKIEKIIGPGEKELSSQSLENGNAAVLIIEDDKFLREVIAQKLRQEGFSVEAVVDADSALEFMKKQRPQIILLDLILPGMDGFEFLEQVKKSPTNGGIPIIVLSNLGQKEDEDRAMAAGAEGYLIKANYTPAEIVQKVRDVIKDKYL